MGARYFPPFQIGPGAHPDSNTRGTGSFPGVKQPGSGVDSHSSSAEVKSRFLPLLWAFVACSRVKFTFTFTLLLQFYPCTSMYNLVQLCINERRDLVHTIVLYCIVLECFLIYVSVFGLMMATHSRRHVADLYVDEVVFGV